MTVVVGVSSSVLDPIGLPDREDVRIAFGYGQADADVLWRRHGDSTEGLIRAVALDDVVRWVHLDTVGVDRLPLDEWRRRGIRVTNGRGLSTVPVAEWVMGGMLLAVRRLHDVVRLSDRRRWEAPSATFATLAGKQVTIIGLGSIGQRVAGLARAFGATVHGIVGAPPSRTDPRRALVDRLGPASEVRAACSDADFVVLCAPLTEASRGILSADILAEMRTTAWIVNAARGELVDEGALADAVAAGRLGGAVLDVTSTEPPPADSPLWSHPDIVLSAHLADHPRADDRQTTRLFLVELEHFLRGEAFQNEVDLVRGY